MCPGTKPEKLKSPSQRLRNVIFKYWAQNIVLRDKYPDFDDYYVIVIEHFITKVKNQLIK